MDDDFNAPVALACLFELSTEIFKGRAANAGGMAIDNARQTLAELGGVLGFRVKALPLQRGSQRSEPFIALADRIRERLKELGVRLEDRADGTTWKFEQPS